MDADLKAILDANGLSSLVDALLAEKITSIEIAAALSDADLKELGVTALGDRKRFIKAVSAAGGAQPPPPLSVSAPPPSAVTVRPDAAGVATPPASVGRGSSYTPAPPPVSSDPYAIPAASAYAIPDPYAAPAASTPPPAMAAAGATERVHPGHIHPLKKMGAPYEGTCNQCAFAFQMQHTLWRCDECSFDICLNCIESPAKHCAHCKGLAGPCKCSSGCARDPAARCALGGHCMHCKGGDGTCACASGCARGPAAKCIKRHCMHCKGGPGTCACPAGCEAPGYAECVKRHCSHCRGLSGDCACTLGCEKMSYCLCTPPRGGAGRPQHCEHCLGGAGTCACEYGCTKPSFASCVKQHCAHCRGNPGECACTVGCKKYSYASCYAPGSALGHCAHCLGGVGTCACAMGCPKKAASKCVKQHCSHCKGMEGECACKSGCSKYPYVWCYIPVAGVGHCAHCKGGDGTCACESGCPKRLGSRCTKQHCAHCKGLDGECACKVGCKKFGYAWCYPATGLDGHCAHCKGGTGTCACSQRCPKRPGSLCEKRHCPHCKGLDGECACKSGCQKYPYAWCYQGTFVGAGHCAHCKGGDGTCACDHGCPKRTGTKCVKQHCSHCRGMDGTCACTIGCSKMGYVWCYPGTGGGAPVASSGHCSHCKGGDGTCACESGCPRPPGAVCIARHCIHCRGLSGECACTGDCWRPSYALCFKPAGGALSGPSAFVKPQVGQWLEVIDPSSRKWYAGTITRVDGESRIQVKYAGKEEWIAQNDYRRMRLITPSADHGPSGAPRGYTFADCNKAVFKPGVGVPSVETAPVVAVDVSKLEVPTKRCPTDPKPGQVCEFLDHRYSWGAVRIVKTHKPKVLIHFLGWDPAWDEWIDYKEHGWRFRPLTLSPSFGTNGADVPANLAKEPQVKFK